MFQEVFECNGYFFIRFIPKDHCSAENHDAWKDLVDDKETFHSRYEPPLLSRDVEAQLQVRLKVAQKSRGHAMERFSWIFTASIEARRLNKDAPSGKR